MEYIWELNGAKFDKENKILAILPIGSLERHGNHLPLGTDTIEAQFIAEKVAEKLNGHIFPPIWYGSSMGLSRFPGTINIEDDAFKGYVKSLLKEIARNGYQLILIINGHGGNTSLINISAKEAAYEMNSTYVIIDWWRDVGKEARQKLFSMPGHAGDDETSAMLFIDGNHVDMKYATDYNPNLLPKVSVQSPIIEHYLYPNAVLGGGTKGDPLKGKQWIDAVIDDIIKIVDNINQIMKTNKLEK
ncbi:MAG: creatininase family protein [Caldisphaera sp.]|nr:MAG: creatininase [Caldisphaera sp.]PMP91407.1 MAG: creatininase [Caldisphaera sp.]